MPLKEEFITYNSQEEGAHCTMWTTQGITRVGQEAGGAGGNHEQITFITIAMKFLGGIISY